MKWALSEGASLGRYRIVGALGAGGMGQVYEAEDTRLGRRVALKLLPPMLDDPLRRKRFEREARSIAALSHPSIVAVHAVEEVDGHVFIVMERVRGRSLAELIPPGGLSAEVLLRLAVPLVDAVGAAHRRGITHRDLKPQNVMVDEDGRLRVLDFGLAKGATADSGVPDTTATAEGAILGTVAYMSPEQAQGLPVDPRSDVFSLGVLLFEMATGRRPFTGASNLSIITAILRDPAPSASELNPACGPGLERVIRRCLEKDPDRRYASAVELRQDLEALRDRPGAAPLRVPWQPSRRAAVVAGVALGAAALGAAAMRLATRAGPLPAAGPRVVQVEPLTADEGPELSPSLSPDGTWFVYARPFHGNMDLFRQRVGGENPMNLTADSPADEDEPAISPDGEHIAFWSSRGGGGIYLMGATGESVRRIADIGRHPAWSPDGTQIAFCTEKVQLDATIGGGASEVWVLTLAGGERRRVVGGDAAQPRFSPHGLRLAYFAVDANYRRDLWTVRVDGGDPVKLTDDAALDWNPVWSPDGRWLYFASDRGGFASLWRLPVDEGTGRATGAPEPVTLGAGVRTLSPSFSRDGTRVAFVADATRYLIRRVAFDPAREALAGTPEPVLARASYPDVHGDQIAFEYGDVRSVGIGVSRVDGTGRRRLTEDAFRNHAPQWSPDGERIAFRSDRSGKRQCWSIRPDGSELRQLTDLPGGVEGRRCLWSPDGAHMAVRTDGGKVAIFDPGRPWADQAPRMIAAPAPDAGFTPWSWSADGRSVAGVETHPPDPVGALLLDVATGQYRRPPEPTALPQWLADSNRLLYQSDGQISLLDLRTGAHHRVLADPFEGIGTFTLSADQAWIYYEHIALETDVWMATLGEAR